MKKKQQGNIKHPHMLVLHNLEHNAALRELELKSAMITNLQWFLLKLDIGLAFVASHKRLVIDDKTTFVDLVSYSRQLRCNVLFNLKSGRPKQQDIERMQMQIRGYEYNNEKLDFETPTIGVLLCQKKSESTVEFVLPDDSNIPVSKYNLCLPDKAILLRKLDELVSGSELLQADGIDLITGPVAGVDC
jgi:hypothetical protein